jgi:hypothetical protein
LWLYLDAKSLKPHFDPIKKAAKKELKRIRCDFKEIKCVVLDSWTSHEKHSYKLLKTLCTVFKDVPIIVMHTVDDTQFLNQPLEEIIDREFEVLYLWALPGGHIRKVVADYNEEKQIGDEDALITRVVSDLEMLNIH